MERPPATDSRLSNEPKGSNMRRLLSKSDIVLGPWLEMEPEREEFVGSSELTARANQLLRGRYRKPFVVPDQV